MRKISVAENLLIEMLIIFIDFHERTYLHYMKYFIYSVRAYIHSHICIDIYILVCTYINA